MSNLDLRPATPPSPELNPGQFVHTPEAVSITPEFNPQAAIDAARGAIFAPEAMLGNDIPTTSTPEQHEHVDLNHILGSMIGLGDGMEALRNGTITRD